jgi:2,3-diketo-5-methylthiopentyl-1-phosphate enolase
MIGMDMPLVYPDSGRFGITTNQLIETYYATTAPMGHIKKGLLVVAGGVHPGTVPYLMNLLGDDTMLMAGGGIYGHPHGAESGATAILQAINSVKKGLGLAEAAEEYKELKVALDYWKK